MSEVKLYELLRREETLDEFLESHRKYLRHLEEIDEVFEELGENAQVIACLWGKVEDDLYERSLDLL